MLCARPTGSEGDMSDYTLSGGNGLDTAYAAVRISRRFVPADGIQSGFNGDYSGLGVAGEIAHPIWSDTRNAVAVQFNSPTLQGVPHHEDVFTTAQPVPSGHGEQD